MLGSTRNVLPSRLSQALDRAAADRTAFLEPATGRSTTFGEIKQSAIAHIGALQLLGLQEDDTVVYLLEDRLHLVPFLVACCDLGLRLVIRCATSKPGHEPAGSRRPPAKLVIGSAQLRRFWEGTEKPKQFLTQQGLNRAGECAAAEWGASSWLCREAGRVGICKGEAEPAWITQSMLLLSAANFHAAYPLSAADTLVSTSSTLTIDGLCTSVIIPLMLGTSTVLADTKLLSDPPAYWNLAAQVGATVCENPAAGVQLLLASDGARDRQIPDPIRFLLGGSGILPQSTRRQAERAWNRRIYQGYGTAEHGFWLACSPYLGASDALSVRSEAIPGFEIAIRPLRAPLSLLSLEDGIPADWGEILFRRIPAEAAPSAKPKPGGEYRTGDLGRLTEAGELFVQHKIADLAVRGGCAVLLTEVDALLCQHQAVAASRTFREQANSPLSRVIAACVTDLPGAELRQWLADRFHPRWVPDEIVPVEQLPCGPALDVQVDTLRAMVSGTACNDLVAALTARKFRRSPCHKAPELRERIQSSILAMRPVQFFMFWGCGPRRESAAPDHAALAALEDLLDCVGRLTPVRAQAEIVLTDVHARNNGFPEDHYAEYFSQIERAAAGLNVTFRRETDVWARHGLTMEQVGRFGASEAFEAKWQSFPLQDRFMTQASRHSRMADRAQAARRYYAICLLEREVLKAEYQQSIFLTYNGPEFNDCFPDVPTLYVYPGPRGRTDKPWFVQAVTEPAEPAEMQAPSPAPLLLAS